ncbi:hypothetical protein GCM10009825_12010 [Arthrobacter humicola]|uniref:Helix-turn-helix domain-containing protein n=1 Tax=Arthrobacter humicola TaxID=409291 RepID=A0ABN2YSQ6_9MICC
MTNPETTSQPVEKAGGGPRRFLTIEQAAEELNVSDAQIRTLLRAGELRGIQIGGRGLWGIGARDLEDYIDPRTPAP